jgi:hypothetical protein
MKKIKKSLAVVLSLAMVITMLSACTSTGNSDKTAEEPTSRPTESVTTTEPTEEDSPKPTEEVVTTTPTQEVTENPTQTPTEEPTVSVTEPVGDVIIPLYYSGKESEIRQVNPADFYDYSNFTMYFYPVTPAGRTLENGFELNTISYGTRFVLSADPISGQTGTYDVDIYFYCGNLDTMMYMMYYEVGDTNGVLDSFIPMWYNETKGCLVGYTRLDEDGEISYVLYEVYYNPIYNNLSSSQVVEDLSLYGF